MELDRESKTSLNITSEAEVLSYTSASMREVMARVQLGTAGQPIVGNGSYHMRLYVNSVRVVPDSPVSVPSGVTSAISNSRAVVLDTGETLSVRVVGLGGDTAVSTITILRDATAISVSDVTGGGLVTVNHNYGGTDVLAYKTSGGQGIVGASITAYLKSDYDAGNRSSNYVVGRSTTVNNGRWATDILLNPQTYTVVFFKQGPNSYGPNTATVVVV